MGIKPDQNWIDGDDDDDIDNDDDDDDDDGDVKLNLLLVTMVGGVHGKVQNQKGI